MSSNQTPDGIEWEECSPMQCGEGSSVLLRMIKMTRSVAKKNAQPVQNAWVTAQDHYALLQQRAIETTANTHSILREDPRYIVYGSGSAVFLYSLTKGWFRGSIPLGLATSAFVSHTAYPEFLPSLQDKFVSSVKHQVSELWSQYGSK
eukprot:TRINITY_DN540_c0_g1_i2.p1 TRINITY_DN540_c0_g1~~TRINITY_DN540_c0_g1_i2.p1  ORF type:complete len:148 (-),score=29.35 TRINITY_DN540_c0_g1_i2:201-644(-)